MSKKVDSISIWMSRHALIVWIGILLNLCLVVPLLFTPVWFLDMLGIQITQTIWARFAAGLLFIITCFYVPATIDLQRYRANAWLAVIPSRAFGTVFFFFAVFVFDQPYGFIIGVLLDGTIGAASLYCLIKVTALEHAQRFGAQT